MSDKPFLLSGASASNCQFRAKNPNQINKQLALHAKGLKYSIIIIIII